MECSHGSLSALWVCMCVYLCLCASIPVSRGKEKRPDNVGAQNRKGFKIRLQCKGGNSSTGRFLLLSLGPGSWISSASLPSPRAGGRLWVRTGTTSLLDHGLMCREDRARDCALSLAAMGMQREVGTSGYGSLSVSLQGQWFLAQDVVAGKPDCSGMLCSRVLWFCSPHRQARTQCTRLAGCEHPQAADTPSLTALHTGSLVTLTRHWNPMTHFSGP